MRNMIQGILKAAREKQLITNKEPSIRLAPQLLAEFMETRMQFDDVLVLKKKYCQLRILF